MDRHALHMQSFLLSRSSNDIRTESSVLFDNSGELAEISIQVSSNNVHVVMCYVCVV